MNKKSGFFLALILFGLFGRWILYPSLQRLKKDSEQKIMLKKQRAQQDKDLCIRKGSCTLNDLFDEYLHARHLDELRTYFVKNYTRFIGAWPYKTSLLVGKLVGDVNTELYFSELFKDGLGYQKSLLHGLYLCHRQACYDYAKLNIETWEKIEGLEEQTNMLKIKLPGSWQKKNTYLHALLDGYEAERKFYKSIALIDFIPNHPALKKYIQKYYLSFKKREQLQRSSVYLSRYLSGWHDREASKVLNSSNTLAISEFIKTMKIGCPQKLDYIIGHFKSFNDEVKKSFLEELRYLTKKSFPEIGFKGSSSIENSKCFN